MSSVPGDVKECAGIDRVSEVPVKAPGRALGCVWV